MKRMHSSRFLAALIGFAFLAGAAQADLYQKTDVKTDGIKLPTPAEIQTLAVEPATVSLIGLDDSNQLIVSGKLANGREQDLSGNVKFQIEKKGVVEVTAAGRVIPIANGETVITVQYGNKTAQVPVKTTSCDVNLPINFANHIVPIFTKLGCNSGGCHGKSGGQNGFGLSLLGFVPEMDYQTLVKENRGRRLFPASPDHSLLLLKATGRMAHGGGSRLEADSDEYKITRRWIASGMPFGSPEDPVVEKITVFPEHRILARNNRQQLRVLAHYSDGAIQDVTYRAQYESNDQDVVIVDAKGLCRTLDVSGPAAVMARYQGQVTVFRATVPLGVKTPEYKFAHNTLVDQFTHKQWQQLDIVPANLSTDEVFIRRVYLDIAGSLPSPKDIREFIASTDPKKREKLVDVLLDSPEYSYFFANRWANILRVRRGNQAARAFGTFAMYNWLRKSVAQNKPYDQFAREILAAIGDETKNPTAVWYETITKPETFVDDTAQLFLGVRMACAQCHHHPYEKWSQDDYWGLAAFYSRVGRKNVTIPGTVQNNQARTVAIYVKDSGTVTNKRTNKPAEIKPPDGDPVEIQPGEDPRHRLVDWMVSPKNPFFARAIVNRYWAHFFGRGIVDPVDDIRVTNPPSNPELLDALAQDLIKNKFDLKQLIRTICNSRTYQLSSLPNEFNKHDKSTFARFYPRRMTAEVLYDAVSHVTKTPAVFPGLPRDKFSPQRAIMLPDESFASYFLDVFGRPQRLSACECERVTEANLAQALHLLNSQEVQTKLSQTNARAFTLANDTRPHAEKVEEMFLWALARRPTTQQMDLALRNIEINAKNVRVAYENILWALINTKEFIIVK